ncbi:MAG TPA: preprotein translocase subunit SecG [Thermoanaerobaculia bacterium]
MYIALVSIYVIVCIFLILVVLLQQGKGADIAGAFGGGGSQTAFGARGATTFLHKLTTVAFIGFVVLSMLLSIIEARPRSSVIKTLPGAPAQKAPAAPVPPGQPVPGTGAPGTSSQPSSQGAAPAAPAQPAPATSTQGSSQPNPKP